MGIDFFWGGGDRNVLELGCGDTCITVNTLKATELCTSSGIFWVE
jgi:hypothetical protein